MPRTRQYSSDAERQAAYRGRSASREVGANLPEVIVTTPGPRRWHGLVQQAERTLKLVHSEMQSYYDSRSERWQESEKAEDLMERQEALAEIQEMVQDWMKNR